MRSIRGRLVENVGRPVGKLPGASASHGTVTKSGAPNIPNPLVEPPKSAAAREPRPLHSGAPTPAEQVGAAAGGALDRARELWVLPLRCTVASGVRRMRAGPKKIPGAPAGSSASMGSGACSSPVLNRTSATSCVARRRTGARACSFHVQKVILVQITRSPTDPAGCPPLLIHASATVRCAVRSVVQVNKRVRSLGLPVCKYAVTSGIQTHDRA